LLTHPRNAGRHNLRCPFGCREAHRKKHPPRRSAASYSDPAGKVKQSALNQRRASKSSAKGQTPAVPEAPVPKKGSAKWSPPMVEHVRMVVSLIEGRRVSRRQVLAILAKVLRQHTMVRRRKIDQAVAWLNEQPP